jgi:hypothetical protein
MSLGPFLCPVHQLHGCRRYPLSCALVSLPSGLPSRCRCHRQCRYHCRCLRLRRYCAVAIAVAIAIAVTPFPVRWSPCPLESAPIPPLCYPRLSLLCAFFQPSPTSFPPGLHSSAPHRGVDASAPPDRTMVWLAPGRNLSFASSGEGFPYRPFVQLCPSVTAGTPFRLILLSFIGGSDPCPLPVLGLRLRVSPRYSFTVISCCFRMPPILPLFRARLEILVLPCPASSKGVSTACLIRPLSSSLLACNGPHLALVKEIAPDLPGVRDRASLRRRLSPLVVTDSPPSRLSLPSPSVPCLLLPELSVPSHSWLSE